MRNGVSEKGKVLLQLTWLMIRSFTMNHKKYSLPLQQQRWSEAGLGAVGGRGPVLSGFHPRGDTQLALPSVNLQRLGAAGAGNAP